MKKSEKKLLQKQKNKTLARAKVKFLRIAPRKVRIVIDTIRHKHPETALHILSSLNKKAARMTEKLVKTAIANAKVLGLDENRLTISDIRADGGPVMKRFMERSMGRADRVLKRTTHLSIVISEKPFSGGNQNQPLEKKAETKDSTKSVKTEKAAKGKKKAMAGKA